jgi:hypothetical protein
VLDIPLYHGLSRDNTYMSQVGVDITLHNVLVVGSYGTLLDLFLFQILYLVLHLGIHLDLLVLHCTEVPDYNAQGYTEVVCYCIAVV